MAVSMNKGLVRVGIFLSVLWIIAVGVYAAAEGNHRNDACAITPNAGYCHYKFWAWVAPQSSVQTTRPRADETSEERLKRAIVKTIVTAIDEVQAREFRLQPDRLLIGMFAPLAVMWGLGFGLAWVVQGFRQPK